MPMDSSPYKDMDGPALRDALFEETGVQPIRSVDDWACEGVFDSYDELHEFRDWLASERKHPD